MGMNAVRQRWLEANEYYCFGIPHNPHRVRADEIPEGCRLMARHEIRKYEDATVRRWYPYIQQFGKPQNQKIRSDRTYAVENTDGLDPIQLVKRLTPAETALIAQAYEDHADP